MNDDFIASMKKNNRIFYVLKLRKFNVFRVLKIKLAIQI